MKKLRRPVDKETHAYMKERQKQNIVSCKKSKAEDWMKDKLAETGLKWRRQAEWGYRLFDFWNHKLGIAVEVDGKEHNKEYDSYRDKYNYERSGIIVLRVRNFNEDDAITALSVIGKTEDWLERRKKMGLLTKAQSIKISIAPALHYK